MNGLVTPTSYPLIDEPQIQDLNTALDDLPINFYDQENMYAQPFNAEYHQYWQPQQMPKAQPMYMDQSNLNEYDQFWQLNHYMGNANLQEQPGAPTFIPIENNLEEPEHLNLLSPNRDEDDGEDELVGMGLYDSPAEVQSSTLLFGGGLNGGVIPPRRSLKLEDAFEPSENNDDADQDDQNDDATSQSLEEFDLTDETNDIVPTISQEERLYGHESSSHAPVCSLDINQDDFGNDWQRTAFAGYGWV